DHDAAAEQRHGRGVRRPRRLRLRQLSLFPGARPDAVRRSALRHQIKRARLAPGPRATTTPCSETLYPPILPLTIGANAVRPSSAAAPVPSALPNFALN